MANILISVCLALLMILTVMSVSMLNHVQDIARVINYTGIVRGATQRLIKLEIADVKSEEIQNNINGILNGLRYGSIEYNLGKLNDKNFNDKMNILYDYWLLLESEIEAARNVGYENTNLLVMSEQYFALADKTVSAAEEYSDFVTKNLTHTILSILAINLGLLIYFAKHTLGIYKLMDQNKALSEKAFLDLHTRLPNKSKCNELVYSGEKVKVGTCLIMFDINNLKYVNDTLGHLAGDLLIQNFAYLLRKCVNEDYFVGRFGGDEFIVIVEDTSEEKIKEMIKKIEAGISTFNKYENNQADISYSHGYAISSKSNKSTLEDLLLDADKNMYINKKITKQKLVY